MLESETLEDVEVIDDRLGLVGLDEEKSLLNRYKSLLEPHVNLSVTAPSGKEFLYHIKKPDQYNRRFIIQGPVDG